MSVQATAFLPSTAARHLRRPQLRTALRARPICTTYACAVRRAVDVRVACADDLRPLARMLTRAFLAEDAGVQWLQTAFFGRRMPGTSYTIALYERLSYMELVGQFSKRLVEPERLGIGDEFRKEHVIFVAVDGDNGAVVGCVEMGLVDLPRVLAGGLASEVRVWEQNALRARNGAAREADDGRERAAYIGNLAVCSEYRRRGIGGRLVECAERFASEAWGRTAVCLHVDGKNEGAKLLYARRGFECEMQEPEWHDDVGRVRRMFLRKRLGQQVAAENGDVGVWDGARVVASKRMNGLEYLVWCVRDLQKVAKQ